MTTILVTGAGGSAAANFVRSLRMADAATAAHLQGLRIIGVDARPEHLHATPGLDERHVVPRCDDSEYADALIRLCHQYGVDLVHAQPDTEVAAIGRLRDRLPAATFLPDNHVIELCHDKLQCQAQLNAAGVAVPVSVRADDDAAVTAVVTDLAGQDPEGRVWVRAIRGAGSRGALPVQTGEQAISWMNYWRDMRGVDRHDFMVCEYLPGDEFAFQSLWHEGALVTSAARKRVEYLFGHLTPSGQTSTPAIAVSVHDDQVNTIAAAAVAGVDSRPHGVYCVDMKSGADGVPRVTEINCGRFFTTSDFFAAAGANMPHTYLSLALGHPIPDLPRLNAVPADLWWVRNIDVPPALVAARDWNVHDGTARG